MTEKNEPQEQVGTPAQCPAEPRKSRIQKSIRRVIQTQPFESLEVIVAFDEEITWSNIKERQEKSQNLTKLLMMDFKASSDIALTSLGLNRTVASVKNNLDKTSTGIAGDYDSAISVETPEK